MKVSCCRDYRIGNVTLKSVPDSFVIKATEFRGAYGFAKGNVDEFVERVEMEIPYNESFKWIKQRSPK